MYGIALRFSAGQRGARRFDERGAVAVVTAFSLVFILVAVAMALDLGLVRTDRQVDKSAADAAALAGVEGLSLGGAENFPYRGVCTALRYMQSNAPRFSVMSDTTGTWTDASGNSKANGCTDATLRNSPCLPNNQTSWAKFTWTGTWADRPIQVTIQSGYKLDGADASTWSEETLTAVAADNQDASQGCDQLVVIVKQNRKPGFGSVVRSADLSTRVRSVGRTKIGPGSDAPAMLLLKQTGCPVLQTGSNSGGSFIHVLGAVSSNGRTQAGSIHADSNGVGCGSSIFMGRAAAGIVAYAAPMSATNPAPDPAKPGLITSVAGANGLGIGTVRDVAGQVYGSTATNPAAASVATKNEPNGRTLVTRGSVDERYLSGVRTAMANATSSVFASVTNATIASTQGYAVLSDCNPTSLTAAQSSATRLYVDCTDNNGYKGAVPLPNQTIVFAGKVNPSATLSLPNAKKVYVFGSSSDAISIGSATFSMHTAGNLTGTTCKNDFTADRAVLFIKDGAFKQTGGALQLCNTTVMMLGGRPDGCAPATNGTPPTQTPCGGAMGSGQLSMTGGTVDWTAPNEHDLMTLPNGDPDPSLAPAWSNPDGPEDLAFWSESAGNNSSTTYNMAGTGTFHVRGVYMVPNADSFSIGGGGTQTLTNAQYIATSIFLNGNTTNITMAVDPNSAVVLPKKRLVGLVR